MLTVMMFIIKILSIFDKREKRMEKIMKRMVAITSMACILSLVHIDVLISAEETNFKALLSQMKDASVKDSLLTLKKIAKAAREELYIADDEYIHWFTGIKLTLENIRNDWETKETAGKSIFKSKMPMYFSKTVKPKLNSIINMLEKAPSVAQEKPTIENIEAKNETFLLKLMSKANEWGKAAKKGTKIEIHTDEFHEAIRMISANYQEFERLQSKIDQRIAARKKETEEQEESSFISKMGGLSTNLENLSTKLSQDQIRASAIGSLVGATMVLFVSIEINRSQWAKETKVMKKLTMRNSLGALSKHISSEIKMLTQSFKEQMI